MQNNKDYVRHLSKTLSYILRHEPWLYELELDEDGWVLVSDLLIVLENRNKDWMNLNELDLVALNNQATKKRFEIANGKIRALYGHSTPKKIIKEKMTPPEILFHGTSEKLFQLIKVEGLKPVKRQYVHLSTDIEMATEVGKRKDIHHIILKINSKAAYENQINFYYASDRVWLADFILPEFIEKNNVL